MTSTAPLVLVLAGLAATPAAAAATHLVPHRAVYDLSLAEGIGAMSDSAPEMTGRMVYEFTGGPCEGYTTNFRFVVETTDDGGNRSVTDLRTSNHEDGDGRGFQFVSQTYTNDVLTEDVKGTAALGADDKLSVKLTGRDQPVVFPRKASFPTEHLVKMIDAAEAGQRVVERDIFDGSDGGDTIYRTTTMIGAPRTGTATGVAAVLGDTTRWPVTVSYFDPEGTGDQTPDYTISFDLWANGVSSDMTMDYGDFALTGTLRQYEALPETKCD